MASKTIETTIRTAEELGGVLGEYAQAVLDRERVENALEAGIARLREEARPELETLKATEKALLDDMAAYATLHPEIFPKGRKSLELAHGTVGFRTGQPRVTLRRGLKEEDLVERLMQDGIDSLIRTRPELDRDQAIRQWQEVLRRDQAGGRVMARRLQSWAGRRAAAEGGAQRLLFNRDWAKPPSSSNPTAGRSSKTRAAKARCPHLGVRVP